MKKSPIIAAILSIAIAMPAMAAGTSKSPLMDKFVEFYYKVRATGQAVPFPLTDEEISRFIKHAKELYKEDGIELTDQQATMIAGAMAVFGSTGYPVRKFPDHLKKFREEAVQAGIEIPKATLPSWLPIIDFKAYCEEFTERTNGGAFIENSCRQTEANALYDIMQMDVDDKTGKYCSKFMERTKGGYSTMKSCIDRELIARKAMGK